MRIILWRRKHRYSNFTFSSENFVNFLSTVRAVGISNILSHQILCKVVIWQMDKILIHFGCIFRKLTSSSSDGRFNGNEFLTFFKQFLAPYFVYNTNEQFGDDEIHSQSPDSELCSQQVKHRIWYSVFHIENKIFEKCHFFLSSPHQCWNQKFIRLTRNEIIRSDIMQQLQSFFSKIHRQKEKKLWRNTHMHAFDDDFRFIISAFLTNKQ